MVATATVPLPAAMRTVVVARTPSLQHVALVEAAAAWRETSWSELLDSESGWMDGGLQP